MAIRLKNLDLNAPGLKGYAQVSLGDITATTERGIFVAPVACVVDFIDVYTGQAVNVSASNSVTIMTIRAQLAAVSGSALVTRGTSANGVSTTNDIQANTRYRLTPSGNNSLSVGTPLELVFSQQGSGVMSAVMVVTQYTPLVHRETR